MKFQVRAKLGAKAKNFWFSVPLDRAMSRSKTRYVEKLQSHVAELFSVEVIAISILTSTDSKEKAKNDRQLVDHMLCTPESVRIYVIKKEEKSEKTKKTSCCAPKKKSKKKYPKPKKQERKNVNDSDLLDCDCDCTCWVACDCLDIKDFSDSSSSSESDSDFDSDCDCICVCACDLVSSESDCDCDGCKDKFDKEVPDATLERGDTGDDVKLLQKHLQEFGFLDKDSYYSGRFGCATAQAVKDFRFAYAAGGNSDKGKYDRGTAKALKELVSDFACF